MAEWQLVGGGFDNVQFSVPAADENESWADTPATPSEDTTLSDMSSSVISVAADDSTILSFDSEIYGYTYDISSGYNLIDESLWPSLITIPSCSVSGSIYVIAFESDSAFTVRQHPFAFEVGESVDDIPEDALWEDDSVEETYWGGVAIDNNYAVFAGEDEVFAYDNDSPSRQWDNGLDSDYDPSSSDLPPDLGMDGSANRVAIIYDNYLYVLYQSSGSLVYKKTLRADAISTDVREDSVVVGTDDGTIRCFDLSGGHRWSTNVSGSVYGIAVGDNVVFAGTSTNELHGLAAADGLLISTYAADATITDVDYADGRIVYGTTNNVTPVVNWDGHQFVLRVSDGSDWIQL